MRKKIINCSFLFFLLLIFTACERFLYDENKKIPEAVWAYKDLMEFNFEITDTVSLYNIYLEVKHDAVYNAQNIYAKVYVTFPDAKERNQLVSLELADNRGEWLGKCSAKSCTRRIPFMPNASFDQIGKYKLKFEQFTRQEKVKGIESLRMIVEKIKKDNTDKNKAKKTVS
jgi:gliding motility-associated lipoprotein GldH